MMKFVVRIEEFQTSTPDQPTLLDLAFSARDQRWSGLKPWIINYRWERFVTAMLWEIFEVKSSPSKRNVQLRLSEVIARGSSVVTMSRINRWWRVLQISRDWPSEVFEISRSICTTSAYFQQLISLSFSFSFCVLSRSSSWACSWACSWMSVTCTGAPLWTLSTKPQP